MTNPLKTFTLLIAVILILGIHCDDQGDWVDPYLLPI